MAGWLAWAGLARGAAPAPTPASPAPAAHGDLVFHGMRVWHFRGSRLSSRGSAERVEYERSTGQGLGIQVESTLLPSREDQKPVNLQAGQATGRLGDREVDGTEGVRLEREDGTVVTHSAHYAAGPHLITGQEPVEATTPRFHITGSAFTLDTESEQIEMAGPVVGKGRVSR